MVIFITIVSLTLGLLFSIILVTLGWATLSAAPWVPLKKKDIRRMLKIAEVKPGELVYDLGCGDGRIVYIAAKEFGAKAKGIELSFLIYLLSCIKMKLLTRGKKLDTKIKYGDFFLENLGQADVITAFLTPRGMKKLKPKFLKELKPGCRVVSFAFKIPDWQPEVVDKPNKKTTSIFLYRKT